VSKLFPFSTWTTRHTVISIVALVVLLCAVLYFPLRPYLANAFTHREAAVQHVSNNVQNKLGNDTTNADGKLIAWPAFDGGGQRSGINANETTITTDNVGQLTRLWQQKLPATADGAPVELPGVQTANGVKTLLFVTTTTGSLLAIDAENGEQIWRKDTSGPKFTTSSPALDPSGKYVYGYGLDGKIHKYAVGDGEEFMDKTWPAVATEMPIDEKGSSPINIANGYLYMAIAGYPGDGGHYEGHIVAINLKSGIKTVFNTLCANIPHVLTRGDCTDVQSAIWGRGAPTVDPVTGNVFVTTGNGAFRGDGRSFGDSVIELSADLTKVIDSYTPASFQRLQDLDQDLGSAVPAILPKQANSKTPYLMVQAGKDDTLRMLNRQDLSGQGGPNHTGGEVQEVRLPIKGVIVTHPLAWNDPQGTTWLFVANTYYLFGYKVVTDAEGKTTLQLAYQNKNGGSSPFLANNILYVQAKGVLRAMNPTTGEILWSSTQPSAGGSTGKLHWQSPIVVNGHIYVPDDSGYLSAYGLK
jgi:outer membrane protein assembly factor BamB